MARTQNSNSGNGGPSRRRGNVEQGTVETDEETLIGGKGNLGGGKVLCAESCGRKGSQKMTASLSCG